MVNSRAMLQDGRAMSKMVGRVGAKGPRVLVLDAEQRSALAAIRSIGSFGADVIAASLEASPLAATSKFVRAVVNLPDPAIDARAYVDAVRYHAARLDVEFILPITDTSTTLLSPPGDVGCARVLAPPVDAYHRVSDKANLLQMAAACQVGYPESIVVRDRAQLVAAADEIGYPFILKPSRSKYLHEGKVFSTAVKLISSRAALTQTLIRLDWLDIVPGLVQEFIPGSGAGIFTMYGNAGPVAWFSHRRLREKPPSGGVSVLSESVAPDSRLRQGAQRLLDSVGWCGPAMVEFRISSDGTPYLMEINGRFWGSLQLSIDAGVNFPVLLLRLASEGNVPEISAYRTGRRLRWLQGDLDSLLISLKGPQGTPMKLRAALAFFATFADINARQEIFRWSDPRPAAAEWIRWVRALAT
jgi:predicted ATP-grasp superfamily ATP-dependent carboligase